MTPGAWWRWGLAVLLLLGGGAPLWMHASEPGLFLALNHAAQAVPDSGWAILSLLGTTWGVLGLTAPLLVVAPRLLMAWICAAPFATVLVRAGKGLIDSPRPAGVLQAEQFHRLGEPLHLASMPSGHTLTAFAVATAIYLALPAQRRWRHAWLFVLAAGVGLSRIAVGAHWPGDVLVGAGLGMASGLAAQLLLARIGARHWQVGVWSQHVLALVLASATVPLWTEGLDFAEALPAQRVLVGVIGVSLLAYARRWLRYRSAAAVG